MLFTGPGKEDVITIIYEMTELMSVITYIMRI